ncbi:UxaA family hydrolase [Pseudobacter ginsenosidimutans]|uniref:Altronate hydrolase n=1 Tax=Pseudobacter ginsenosidimutans TaxID=661488 RepID=A0A4Q7N0Y0_9BACT|nr:altronate dehydratase family protein [Pseudobacter ginsenosidimutans]QEC43438.1 altronate dehydratase [Pseudobacter ginsenosidimutans]RZS74822.1 altronate hydrolase [Pseudobacter ginsenosidimutans]
MQATHTYLQIHPDDNILVALQDLPKGTEIRHNGHQFRLIEPVAGKHKFTMSDLAPGDQIFMYGVLVGKADKPIPQGSALTTGNIHHASSDFTLGERKLQWSKPDVNKWKDRQFMGYHRADGSVGTANYWVVIPMVFCENRNVEVLKEALVDKLGYSKVKAFDHDVEMLVNMYQQGVSEDEILAMELSGKPASQNNKKVFRNIDGIKFLNHEMGCGGTRMDADALCGLLAGYVTHPNVAGATILSLGCQHAQASILKKEIMKRDPNFSKPLIVLEQQKEGTENQMLTKAIKRTFAGLMEANKNERKPAPLSKLCIGLECGGSDGFSGISANPAVGYVSDILVTLGSSVILSEFPELCGVEQELSDRCVDESTALKFMDLMRVYNAKAEADGSGFYANPSPGNIRDGLITDAIKSAGAAKKGGTSPVTDVLDYPERVSKPGLNLLCTPGNDVESTTAEVGSGANVVLFTTGLGTPTGNPVAPVVKLATNTTLFNRMPDILDINCGTIIEGKETIPAAADRIMEYIIDVASGNVQPKAVLLGQDDFIPWRRGVSL